MLVAAPACGRSSDSDVPSHVIAPLLQLDNSLAPVTLLPAIMLHLLHKLTCSLVSGAVPRPMPFPIAFIANLGVAPSAAGNLAAICISVDVLRLDPDAAPTRRTIYAILC